MKRGGVEGEGQDPVLMISGVGQPVDSLEPTGGNPEDSLESEGKPTPLIMRVGRNRARIGAEMAPAADWSDDGAGGGLSGDDRPPAGTGA
jgi:hypothetical protein